MDTIEKSTLLVVDDTPQNIMVMREILGAYYRIKIATSGQSALKLATAQPPDLILLDVCMPDMNGYDVCTSLKDNPATRNIPIIFVTALGAEDDETQGFTLGAADYITKPVNPSVVHARVKAHLALSDQRRHLEHLVAARTRELESANQQLKVSNKQLEQSNHQLSQAHLITLQQLGRASDYRDNETGKHVLRVGSLSKLLGLASGIPEAKAEWLKYAAMMHDIGKIGIRDEILLKPGKLTAEEFEVIKKHPAIGADIIGYQESEVLQMAREISLTHHEKWNGLGYPHGLSGESIPLVGRIVAIVDVFDALTGIKQNKAPWSVEKALELIANDAGKHFDPVLVDLFLGMKDDIQRIVIEYRDK